MRYHATDPTWHPEVIRLEDSAPEMHWGRWSDWRAGDPRWRVRIIDTSDIPVELVADQVVAWIEEERALADRSDLG